MKTFVAITVGVVGGTILTSASLAETPWWIGGYICGSLTWITVDIMQHIGFRE